MPPCSYQTNQSPPRFPARISRRNGKVGSLTESVAVEGRADIDGAAADCANSDGSSRHVLHFLHGGGECAFRVRHRVGRAAVISVTPARPRVNQGNTYHRLFRCLRLRSIACAGTTTSSALSSPGFAAHTAGIALSTRAAVAAEPGNSPPLSMKSSWTGGSPSTVIRVSLRVGLPGTMTGCQSSTGCPASTRSTRSGCAAVRRRWRRSASAHWRSCRAGSPGRKGVMTVGDRDVTVFANFVDGHPEALGDQPQRRCQMINHRTGRIDRGVLLGCPPESQRREEPRDSIGATRNPFLHRHLVSESDMLAACTARIRW